MAKQHCPRLSVPVVLFLFVLVFLTLDTVSTWTTGYVLYKRGEDELIDRATSSALNAAQMRVGLRVLNSSEMLIHTVDYLLQWSQQQRLIPSYQQAFPQALVPPNPRQANDSYFELLALSAALVTQLVDRPLNN